MAAVWRKRLEGRALAAAVTLLPVAVHLVAFTVLGQAAAQGNISLASLAVFAGAVLGVRHLAPHDQATVNLVYGAVAVPVVLGLERCAAGAPHANPMRTISRLPEGAPRGGIRFEAVGFRYPNGTGDVLEGLELWIPVGQSLAIVGANGAGKTTLIKLLCRLYDPAVGRITVDGADLRAISPDKWRHQIAAIFQDFVQYPLAARDNVGFGAPAAMADVARLQEAARRAGALDVIEALPYAWDTVLSRRFTGGTDLSGGQWQRIALARALFAVATGATMLILDEPTASLDVRAEAALYDRFLDLTSGVTTILISHRFSTVRRADRICVLEQGRVVEQGTHAELLAAGGRYAAMFALQAARFTDAADGAALPERAGAPADTADTMRSP
ncbi:MAG: ATP-binding cassette domain-containing protein [Chloroflexi bacterium]|nr:ATP-binding cassette domain-containing protein [Chloroflexota bacterium]